MEKRQRIPKFEEYWYISSGGEILKSADNRWADDDKRFSCGNYFTDRKEAERVANLFHAILKGADVVEVPGEEELKEIPTQKVKGDRYIDAYFTGIADILDWIKYRKQAKEENLQPLREREISIEDWIKSRK